MPEVADGDGTDAAVRARIVREVEAAMDGGAPVALATVVRGGAWELRPGAKLLVRRDGTALGGLGREAVDRCAREAAAAAFTVFPRVEVQTVYAHADGGWANRRSRAAADDAELLLQLYEPPARLLIVGGGHVGLAIAQVGELAGFGIAVLDDREEFANRDRFPMAEEVRCGPVDRELDTFPLHAGVSVVLVSRGHQVDELALRHVVGRGAGYVGMIGSRRRTQTVLRHLAEAGLDRDALARVHTPIGLDIGAETPEEIAVSIVAELILVRRGGSGRPLSRLEHRRQETGEPNEANEASEERETGDGGGAPAAPR